MGNKTKITIDGVKKVRAALDEAQIRVNRSKVSSSYGFNWTDMQTNRVILERIEDIDICVSMISKKIDDILDSFEYNLKEVANWDGGKDELSSSLTKSLKKGSAVSVEKANAAYKELRKLVGKKKARQILNGVLSKIGAKDKYKISNGVISLVSTDANQTGAEIRNKESVVVTAPVFAAADAVVNSPYDKVTTNDEMYRNAVERITEISDEKAFANAKISSVYEQATEKIKNIDLNSSDAQQKINAISENAEIEAQQINTELNRKIDEVNMKFGDNYAKLSAADIDAAGQNDVDLNNSITAETYQISRRKETVSNFNNLVQNKLSQASSDSNRAVSVAVQENVQSTNKVTYSAGDSSSSVQSNNVQSSYVNNAGAVHNTSESATASNPVITEVTPAGTSKIDGPSSKATIESKPKVTVIDNSASSNSAHVAPKSSSGAGVVIPTIVGVGALGAAGVAGARYIKNKKATEDIDDNYDDEDNSQYFDDNSSDDYTGPEGSSYQETDDYNSYDDSENLDDQSEYTETPQEEDSYTEIEDYNNYDDFSEDAVLKSIN